MNERKYIITNAVETINEKGVVTLQVNATVTTGQGIRHGEHGNEIPIVKTESISVLIAVSELPTIEKNISQFVLNAVKDAYHTKEDMIAKYKSLIGLEQSETVST